jgi:hypothetical protein
MPFTKTQACGEDTNPTTNRGCEEDFFAPSPTPVDNPFGSF